MATVHRVGWLGLGETQELIAVSDSCFCKQVSPLPGRKHFTPLSPAVRQTQPTRLSGAAGAPAVTLQWASGAPFSAHVGTPEGTCTHVSQADTWLSAELSSLSLLPSSSSL